MSGAAIPFGACPGCGAAAAAARRLFPMAPLHSAPWVLKCEGCGLVFKEVHPAGDALRALYGEGYVHFLGAAGPGAADLNSARQKLRRSLRFLGPARPPAEVRILDVGCGEGQFVQIARGLGYAADGIDPFLPDHLQSPVLRRASPGDLRASSYDVALLLNVAEHVTDPLALFLSVHRLLREGGVLLVTCPHGDSWARKFYRDRWCHMALEEHLLFWTPASLDRCLRAAGFVGRAGCRIGGSPFPYGLAAATSAGVAQETGPDLAPNSVNEPLRMRAQRAAWRLARRIQSQEKLGDAVRWLVSASGAGDYLEFVIARDLRQSVAA